MGSLWEFGSYVTRTISTRNQQNSGLALISQILILLAPICKFWLVSLYEHIILTVGSYQRICLYHPRTNGALLSSTLFYPRSETLQSHIVVCVRRYCLLRSAAYWRCSGNEYRPFGPSPERNSHLHGWYFPSRGLHPSVCRLCSRFPHAVIDGGENWRVRENGQEELEEASIYNLPKLVAYHCGYSNVHFITIAFAQLPRLWPRRILQC